MAASRAGMINRNQPEPVKVGLILDREINDEDIWLIQVGEKRMVTNKTACSKMTGNGLVLLRFVNKSGINVENYQLNT